ncbi:hypothetical protein OXIME_000475 [Oxyplasma meridianum]|uniref:DUF5808 domain-containing protein n=1 Tax=Oxyplasma meridianum TaxID=3073602 RepID=A0AAX4NFG7_9ARCH
MEHNKRKTGKVVNAGYRVRKTFWSIAGDRKHQSPYWSDSKPNLNIYRYPTKKELLKIILSSILTVSMVLLFVFVIHMILW